MPDSPDDQVIFLQNHRPSLIGGTYSIEVRQSISSTDDKIPKNFTSKVGNKEEAVDPDKKVISKTTKSFHVAGERFRLNPKDFQSLFPPAHNLGDHSNVLPHVMLKRSTLPWERLGKKDEDNNIPWLALLVFDADEVAPLKTEGDKNDSANSLAFQSANQDKVTSEIVTLRQLKGDKGVSPPLPATIPNIDDYEPGNKEDDQAKVIDVPPGILRDLMPTADELSWLTHVRKGTHEGTPSESAVVIANRLPKPGATSVVHLVSVEKRFGKDGIFDNSIMVDGKVRLVSLKSWEFTCLERYHVTCESVNHLKSSGILPDNLQIKVRALLNNQKFSNEFFAKETDASSTISGFLTALKSSSLNSDLASRVEGGKVVKSGGRSVQQVLLKAFGFGDFAAILRRLDCSTLRLPTLDDNSPGNPKANAYTSMGYVPAHHYYRRGDKAVSWYHGPLSPISDRHRSKTIDFVLPARASDSLLRYHNAVGMIDASYSAAWEIGRLLAVSDKAFSTKLYAWKRKHAHQLKKEGQLGSGAAEHLPRANVINLGAYQLPVDIGEWFHKLLLLHGLPFNYIVPDEKMLPTESIRFFTLDKIWLAAAIDGAFSVGRVSTHDHQREQDIFHAVLKTAWNPKTKFHLAETLSEPLSKTIANLQTISGCLIRSEVVAGWPELIVDGYFGEAPDNENKLKILRKDYLSENVLLILFHCLPETGLPIIRSQLKTLDIHLKPEALHFGFNTHPIKEGTNTTIGYSKRLRDTKGVEGDIEIKVTPNNRRVLNIDNLTTKEGLIKTIQTEYDKLRIDEKDDQSNNCRIGWEYWQQPEDIPEPKKKSKPTSAELAMQLIEGVEKVRFTVSLVENVIRFVLR